MSQAVYLSEPGAGDLLSGSTGIPLLLKASAETTGGAYALLESTLPPGDLMPVPHIHHAQDEAFYVVAGQLEVRTGDRSFIAAAGAFVLIPRGTPHTYRNAGSEPVTMIVISSPPGIERVFIDLTAARLAAPDRPLPPDLVAEIGHRHGTSYLFALQPGAGITS